MRDAFKLLTAFLLDNGLMERYRLVFFTDGAVRIREYIGKYFGFRQHTVILGRLHLKKKCNEFLSMAIKETKAEKGDIKREFASILWTGDVDRRWYSAAASKTVISKTPNHWTACKEYIGSKKYNQTQYNEWHYGGICQQVESYKEEYVW